MGEKASRPGSTLPAQAVTGAKRAARAPGENPSVGAAWGEDGFTFGDFLDIINPLQHLPVISTLYRKFTGDEIAAGPRLLGGGLFGGPLGVAAAALGVAVAAATGKDIGEHVLALFDGPEKAGTTAIAWATPPAAAVALAAEEPAVAVPVAWTETAPEPAEAAAGPGPSLAAFDAVLVPSEPLLTRIALSSAGYRSGRFETDCRPMLEAARSGHCGWRHQRRYSWRISHTRIPSKGLSL